MIVASPRDQNRSLSPLIEAFLADLARDNRSPHTQRAYATDLKQFAAFHLGSVEDITADLLRSFFATLAHRKPATQARAQAALASFLTWAIRQGWLVATPMAQVPRVPRDPPVPQSVDPATVAAILAAIPATQRRDHLLFRLLAATGLPIDTILALSVEDLDLRRDQLRLHLPGPDQRIYAVLLSEPDLARELQAYLMETGATRGLLFKALKNGSGGPLKPQTVRIRWRCYSAQAGVSCTLRQLREAATTTASIEAIPSHAPTPKERTRQPLPLLSRHSPVDLTSGLRQSSPFQVLPDAALASLATAARYEIYRRGELYLEPRAAVEHFYVVLQGRLGFYRLDAAGHKLTIIAMRDGEIFWFPSRERANGTKSRAEVLSDEARLCSIPRSKVYGLILAHPPFAVALFDNVTRLAVEVADRLGEWVHPAVAVRLAHTLAKCARANADQMVIETHKELAELIGASRATVTSELQRFRAAGLITSHPHHHGIYVPQPERLEALMSVDN